MCYFQHDLPTASFHTHTVLHHTSWIFWCQICSEDLLTLLHWVGSLTHQWAFRLLLEGKFWTLWHAMLQPSVSILNTHCRYTLLISLSYRYWIQITAYAHNSVWILTVLSILFPQCGEEEEQFLLTRGMAVWSQTHSASQSVLGQDPEPQIDLCQRRCCT